MLELRVTNKFEKDLKLMIRRGKSKAKITEIIGFLIKEEPLPPKHCPHKLVGDWAGYLECHIEPDWLLIYLIEDGILRLSRTGSHSDLF